MTSSPKYLFEEIPSEHDISCNLRHARPHHPSIQRTVCFSNSYFHNVLYEWNLLDTKIKSVASLGEFKRKHLATITPLRNPISNVHDIKSIQPLIKLRVEFSNLNEHKFRHNCCEGALLPRLLLIKY